MAQIGETGPFALQISDSRLDAAERCVTMPARAPRKIETPQDQSDLLSFKLLSIYIVHDRAPYPEMDLDLRLVSVWQKKRPRDERVELQGGGFSYSRLV